jgi:hypothetical protein
LPIWICEQQNQIAAVPSFCSRPEKQHRLRRWEQTLRRLEQRRLRGVNAFQRRVRKLQPNLMSRPPCGRHSQHRGNTSGRGETRLRLDRRKEMPVYRKHRGSRFRYSQHGRGLRRDQLRQRPRSHMWKPTPARKREDCRRRKQSRSHPDAGNRCRRQSQTPRPDQSFSTVENMAYARCQLRTVPAQPVSESGSESTPGLRCGLVCQPRQAGRVAHGISGRNSTASQCRVIACRSR